MHGPRRLYPQERRSRRQPQALAAAVFFGQSGRPAFLSIASIVIFGEQHSAWVWLSLATMMTAVALVAPRQRTSLAL